MTPDIEEDMLAAFDAAFGRQPELKAAGTPQKRRAAEKRIGLRHDDGRRKRATGRTAQFNLKIKPEAKASAIEAAKKYDVLIAELAERGFELAIAELAAKGKKR